MTNSRCPRSRSTRRDPLPHTLRFVRHRPWVFLFGALRLLHGLVVILGRLSKCYFFLLAFYSAVCGVGVLGGLVPWEEYYEKIRIAVAIVTESEHDLVRELWRSVEGVASGRGSVAGDRVCPTAPSPRSVAQARTDSRQQGAPQSKTFSSGLCAGYRWLFRRRLAGSPTLPADFLQRILSGAPSCASVSPQHQQQCISKSVVDCCVASTVAC
jgi:hypothetical protein